MCKERLMTIKKTDKENEIDKEKRNRWKKEWKGLVKELNEKRLKRKRKLIRKKTETEIDRNKSHWRKKEAKLSKL